MSTLLIAAILVGSVLAICLLLISIHNKHKRETMNNILKHFNQLGTENNLSFSSQELLNQCVLGLDGVNRKILVVTSENNNYSSFIIDLNEVKNCKVKKIFGTIMAGSLKDHKLEQYLEKIVLQFELHGKPSGEVVFYSNLENHIYEIQELEQRAKHWETILSKMQMHLKNIA
jgi:hypothetical protein